MSNQFRSAEEAEEFSLSKSVRELANIYIYAPSHRIVDYDSCDLYHLDQIRKEFDRLNEQADSLRAENDMLRKAMDLGGRLNNDQKGLSKFLGQVVRACEPEHRVTIDEIAVKIKTFSLDDKVRRVTKMAFDPHTARVNV